MEIIITVEEDKLKEGLSAWYKRNFNEEVNIADLTLPFDKEDFRRAIEDMDENDFEVEFDQ